MIKIALIGIGLYLLFAMANAGLLKLMRIVNKPYPSFTEGEVLFFMALGVIATIAMIIAIPFLYLIDVLPKKLPKPTKTITGWINR